MTTRVTVEASSHDVNVTFLDMIRVAENDIPAVEADPENGIEAQEARTAYAMQPSVDFVPKGETRVYHATSSRTIVVSEVPEPPAA